MKIETFELKIPGRIELTFMNFGGIIQKLIVPDGHGRMGDVLIGFDHPESYMSEHPYFGALIGRYANRINEGKFKLNNKTYNLAINNGPNSLHGGNRGFDKVFWDVKKLDDTAYLLSYTSPDEEEGYPGELKTEVTYRINQGQELIISYEATTTKPTPINLTQHMYFNLSGSFQKNILDHELWINAETYTEVNKDLIPKGIYMSVEGAMDFRRQKKIGRDLDKVSGGYDHNYCLNDVPLRDPKARLVHEMSGRMMEVFTTEPGLQFYSGNFLDGSIKGKQDIPLQKHAGLCLETQHYPDSPNHSHFPTTILNPGDKFLSETVYKFTTLRS